MTEGEIISLILLGDKDKFRLFVEKYQQIVFRTCMGFVHDRDDADDLMGQYGKSSGRMPGWY